MRRSTSMYSESAVLAGYQPTRLLLGNIEEGTVTVSNSSKSKPDSILFKEGVDYIIDYKAGTIRRTQNSCIPDYSSHPMYGARNFDHNTFPVYANHPYFVWVNYNSCEAFKCTSDQKFPVNSYKKLSSGSNFKLVIFGDSISTGAEASMPELTYFGMYKDFLAKQFPRSHISLYNGSKGGDSTVEGLIRLDKDVLEQKPDLVLVAFGMNDHNLRGWGGVEPTQYQKNLNKIVLRIKQQGADVILLSPFPPNPDWKFGTHMMNLYADAVRKSAAQTDSVYADVYSVWIKVLKRKDIQSLLGNNINHPNDFGHWLYFQSLSSIKF